MEFKIGQILNFRYQGGLFPWLIQLGNLLHYHEKGYVHTAIIYDVQGNDIILAQAMTNGFVLDAWDKKALQNLIDNNISEIGETYEKLKNVQENTKKYIGTPYGFLDILDIALWMILGKTSFKIRTNAKSIICSEAVARVLYDCSKNINFEKEFDKSYDLITPTDLSLSKQIKWL